MEPDRSCFNAAQLEYLDWRFGKIEQRLENLEKAVYDLTVKVDRIGDKLQQITDRLDQMDLQRQQLRYDTAVTQLKSSEDDLHGQKKFVSWKERSFGSKLSKIWFPWLKP